MRTVSPKRRQILAAVVEVFNERGYERTGVEHLVKATGLETGSLLTHFADKEECFLVAYSFILSSARARILASVSADASWPQRLAVGLAAVLALIDDDPVAARFVLGASCEGPRATTRRSFVEAMGLVRFMREGRVFARHGDLPPPIIDSVLPDGALFVIRCQLSATPPRPVRPLYKEILSVLLLPYLGEAATAEFMTTDAPRFRPSKPSSVGDEGRNGSVSSVPIVARS